MVQGLFWTSLEHTFNNTNAKNWDDHTREPLDLPPHVQFLLLSSWDQRTTKWREAKEVQPRRSNREQYHWYTFPGGWMAIKFRATTQISFTWVRYFQLKFTPILSFWILISNLIGLECVSIFSSLVHALSYGSSHHMRMEDCIPSGGQWERPKCVTPPDPKWPSQMLIPQSVLFDNVRIIWEKIFL